MLARIIVIILFVIIDIAYYFGAKNFKLSNFEKALK